VDPLGLTARRATVEDLPALQGLWQAADLPWEELDKFVTEFQLVEDSVGNLVGAVGLLVEGTEALLHTEALANSIDADEARAFLWRRIQIVARNLGVHRVWTQEDDPFWTASGFAAPSSHDLAAVNASFLGVGSGWRFLLLVDPSKANAVVQEQMALWQAEREREAEEFQRKVKNFRAVAFLLFGIVLALALGVLWMVMKANLHGRLPR
jgi:N-acetylglutamate synthase-like GNAT family acetyltransferase